MRWTWLVMFAWLSTAPVVAQGVLPGGGDQVGEYSYPNSQYYIGLELYREGNMSDASGRLDAALHNTRRDAVGRWIDAIPVHAMLGECFYQAGDLPAAVEQIDAALAIAIRHRGWMNRLDWNLAIVPGQRATHASASWAGADAPNLLPTAQWIPFATGTSTIAASVNQTPQESAPNMMVDANEILRGLATAMYRRRVIFGPLASESDVARSALMTVDLPGQAFGNSVAGCVHACGHFAVGNDNEVIADSQASSTIGDRVHPLSPLCMLASARVLASRDNYADAVPLALRAAAAASALRQPEWVGEAFQIARGCVVPETADLLRTRATGAASSHLRDGRLASLGAMMAASDAALAIDNVDAADVMVTQAATLLQRREILVPRISAAVDLLAARVAAARGGSIGASPSIDESILRMLAFAYGQGPALNGKRRIQRPGAAMFATPRLFQLGLVGVEANQDGIGGRAVDERLGQFVTDVPSGLLPDAVWRADHVDALAFESYDHSAALNAFLVSTWKRNPPLEALVQSDALLRHRFLSQLPVGGRLQQVRRLAATERQLLVESAAAVFAKPTPRLKRMIEILATPRPMVGSPELAKRGSVLESLATQMALDRGSIPPTMPPPVLGKSDLDRLPKRTALMAFVHVGDVFVGTLAIDGVVKTWSTQSARAVSLEIAKLLRDIGAISLRGAQRLDDQQTWRASAAVLREQLVPEEIMAGLNEVDRIIVVPDGVLWYLPFELLNLNDAGTQSWNDRFMITCSPTPGLVLHPVAYDKPDRPIGVASTLFFAPRDSEINAMELDKITSSLQLYQSLPADPLVASSLIGESIGRLAVFGAVTPNANEPLLTTPGLYDAASPEATLSSWMRFPSSVPVNVFLPGFRTAASHPSLGDGREISTTLLAMHCSGVRDIVLSRWPIGGESTALLSKEFLQELPYDDAHAAWYRAVELLRRSKLDPAVEPLLTGTDAARTDLTGAPPLFWASYLIDSAIE